MEEVAGTQLLPQPEMVARLQNNIGGREYNVFGSVTYEIPRLTRSEMLGILRIRRIEYSVLRKRLYEQGSSIKFNSFLLLQ